jgi:hypothetical protein
MCVNGYVCVCTCMCAAANHAGVSPAAIDACVQSRQRNSEANSNQLMEDILRQMSSLTQVPTIVVNNVALEGSRRSAEGSCFVAAV